MDATEEQLLEDESTGAENLSAHSFSLGQRILVLLLSYLPFVHVSFVVWVALWPWAGAAVRVAGAIVAIYVLPALVGRLIVASSPFSMTTIRLGSADFFKWWALLNLQVLFCRLPALDEILRLIPAAYSMWLRLWGSRIGRLTYWSPGTRVLDRSFLQIGDDVVLGAGVRLNPHVIARNSSGDLELILAPIKIGDRAVVGGYCLLTAGTEVPADETTRACLLSAPFTKWKGGKRVQE